MYKADKQTRKGKARTRLATEKGAGPEGPTPFKKPLDCQATR